MTVAPATLAALQAKLVKTLGTVNLGIVGDQKHIDTGGYHIGAASLRAHGMYDDYSLQYNADKTVTNDYACAIDIGGNINLLMVLGARLVHALINKDPRVYGKVRAVNAPFDGHLEDRRYDCENPDTPADDNLQTSEDQGHIHVEFYRNQVLNPAVMNSFYAVISGAPVKPTKPTKPGNTNKPSPGPKPNQPPPPPDKEDPVAQVIQYVGTSPVKNKNAVYVHQNRVCQRWIDDMDEVKSLLKEYGQVKILQTTHSRPFYGVLIGPDPEPA